MKTPDNETELAALLDECLDALKHEKPVEEILRSHPQHAEQLRPLLLLAGDLRALPDPSPSWRGLSRALAAASQPAPRSHTSCWWKLPWRGLAYATAGAFAALILGWWTSIASSAAVPGDLMYPVKLLTERMKVSLAVNSENKAELRIVFSERRLAEALEKNQRGEEVDAALLSSMLDEARQAIDQSANLPAAQRGYVIRRVGNLTALQQDVLGDLQQQAGPRSAPAIASCMETCRQRMRHMNGMMQQMGMCRRQMGDPSTTNKPGPAHCPMSMP
jgi:hypothetical protein